MHHEDYSKPLDVVWLCRRCHMAHHYQPATLTAHHHHDENVDNSPTSGLHR